MPFLPRNGLKKQKKGKRKKEKEKMKIKHLAMDLETELIGPGRKLPQIACVSIATEKENNLLTPDQGAQALRDFAEKEQGYLVGHHIAFDLGCLLRHDPSLENVIWSLYREKRVWDLGIHERLYCLHHGWSPHPKIGKPIVSDGVSLGQMTKAFLDINLDEFKFSKDSPRFQYGSLIDVPFSQWTEEAIKYALDDARHTFEIFMIQVETMTKEHKHGTLNLDTAMQKDFVLFSLPSFSLQVQSAWAFMHLEAWGLRTSEERVLKWKNDLLSKKDKLKKRPLELGFLKPTGQKNLKAIRNAIELDYGSNTPRTEKGSVSTSSDVLKESSTPALQDLGNMGSIDKLLNTYAPVLEAGTKYPINPRWNVLVRSGRSSCKNPNLQNLARGGGVRECFTPRPGYVYIGADYGTAELCALAQVCLNLGFHSTMAEAINDGKDLHLELASKMLNISYDVAVKRKQQGDKEIKKMRQLAKVPNFGLPGGLSADGLQAFAKSAYDIELDLDTCQRLKVSWFDTWTEMRDYFNFVSKQVRKGYMVQHYTGRRRGGIGFTDGANTLFQGLVADGAKNALIKVVYDCFMEPLSSLYGARPVLFIHDEIILECKEEQASLAGDELARVMLEGIQQFLPDVKIGCDPWASRTWKKGLETVRDEKGNLVIQP